METRFQFNRMELAGSLGDLGTLLPIVVGMILINGLSPTPVFLAFGLFYLFTALSTPRTSCPSPLSLVPLGPFAFSCSPGAFATSRASGFSERTLSQRA
jgi:SulP family sulfate permease